jgi:hypothetical protein
VALPRREQLVQSWQREEQRPFNGWDFSYLEGLLALQERLERGKGLVFEARKYLVEARKPGSRKR